PPLDRQGPRRTRLQPGGLTARGDPACRSLVPIAAPVRAIAKARTLGRGRGTGRMKDGPIEAIILAGGKAERLGAAARGRPKPLVEVAGRPLVSYQIASLAKAGVERVLLSCAAGSGDAFVRELNGVPVEVVPVEEEEPLGRGGGLRDAA